MGYFGRKHEAEMHIDDPPEMAPDNPAITDEMKDKAQEVMSDNMEIMRGIVFRIREDPEFAKSIYKDCPRLQALLDENPDLRPIFEDPKLIRINFEKVYRDNGGHLPEDDPPKEPWLITKWFHAVMERWAVIQSHPLFKVFLILMIIKRILGLLSPTKGISFIKGIFTTLFFEVPPEAPEAPPENIENEKVKAQLLTAADHMEDPEVQEKMQELLADPESMEDTIDNDPQLSTLRDENPLCAELMKDPETMKILVDPDNLRALGECPDLIEADFADPEGFQPEVALEPETVEVVEMEYPETEEVAEEGEPEVEVEEEEDTFSFEDDEDDQNTRKQRGKSRGSNNEKEQGSDLREAVGYMGALGGLAGALGVDFSALNPGFSTLDVDPTLVDSDAGVSANVFDDADASAAVEGIVTIEGEEALSTEAMALESELEEQVLLEEEEGEEEDEETTLQERLQDGLEGTEKDNESQAGRDNNSGQQNDQSARGEHRGMFGSFMGEGKGILLGFVGGIAAGYAKDMAFGQATSLMSDDNAEILEDFQAAVEDEAEEREDEENERADDGDDKTKDTMGDGITKSGVNDSVTPDGTRLVGESGPEAPRSTRFAFLGTAGAALSSVVQDTILSNVLGEDIAGELSSEIDALNEELEKDEQDDEEENSKRTPHSEGMNTNAGDSQCTGATQSSLSTDPFSNTGRGLRASNNA